MTKKLEASTLPNWPRLLDIKMAAAYCGMSIPHFEKHFKATPLEYGKSKRYDRKELDMLIDGTAANDDWTARI